MKSARILGYDYGLSSQEMNYLLKKQGFLDGEPGNYFVTSKGAPYAIEKDFHRGNDGYSHYNRYWETRTWDDNIRNELIVTDDIKKQIRDEIKLNKTISKVLETPINQELNIDKSNITETLTVQNNDVNKKIIIASSIVVVTLISAFVIYKSIKSHRKSKENEEKNNYLNN